MIEENFKNINNLIKEKKIDKAQFELSKLGSKFNKNPEYLYLRSRVFYLNKLYYIAVDTLLIALEFSQDDKIYTLISEIYGVLGNNDLRKNFLNSNSRLSAVNSLKNELSGIYRKNSD
tara:strand:+ start:659 stop:1012 length:354 start_codon:yes stop_codon:yes gene_type:complete